MNFFQIFFLWWLVPFASTIDHLEHFHTSRVHENPSHFIFKSSRSKSRLNKSLPHFSHREPHNFDLGAKVVSSQEFTRKAAYFLLIQLMTLLAKSNLESRKKKKRN